jgi:hypothetical protein
MPENLVEITTFKGSIAALLDLLSQNLVLIQGNTLIYRNVFFATETFLA